jgi:hypothetical protein
MDLTQWKYLYRFLIRTEEIFLNENRLPAINDLESCKIAIGNPFFKTFKKPFGTSKYIPAHFFPNCLFKCVWNP